MIIKELIGNDIMKAYDGKHLSNDFGYSCANFNVRGKFQGYNENTPNTFKFYTENKNNISCIVALNDMGKICGRRMFFKGESLINDDKYEYPIKMGDIVNYLYGYYGSFDRNIERLITNYVMDKYRGFVFTDYAVYNNLRPVDAPNFWIMKVDNMNYNEYPPIDHLYLSTQLKCLSNFNPQKYIIETLKEDFNLTEIKFDAAYRYNPNKRDVRYTYKTWQEHHGNYREEDEDEIDFKVGDFVTLTFNDSVYYVIIDMDDEQKIAELINHQNFKFKVSYEKLNKNYIKI